MTEWNKRESFKVLLDHIEHQIKYPQQEVVMWLFGGGATSHAARQRLIDGCLDPEVQRHVSTFTLCHALMKIGISYEKSG